MPFYQCFKTLDRTVYCSSTQYRNHDEGKEWVTAALAHFQIKANDIKGKPYTSEDQPEGDDVKIWP